MAHHINPSDSSTTPPAASLRESRLPLAKGRTPPRTPTLPIQTAPVGPRPPMPHVVHPISPPSLETAAAGPRPPMPHVVHPISPPSLETAAAIRHQMLAAAHAQLQAARANHTLEIHQAHGNWALSQTHYQSMTLIAMSPAQQQYNDYCLNIAWQTYQQQLAHADHHLTMAESSYDLTMLQLSGVDEQSARIDAATSPMFANTPGRKSKKLDILDIDESLPAPAGADAAPAIEFTPPSPPPPAAAEASEPVVTEAPTSIEPTPPSPPAAAEASEPVVKATAAATPKHYGWGPHVRQKAYVSTTAATPAPKKVNSTPRAMDPKDRAIANYLKKTEFDRITTSYKNRGFDTFQPEGSKMHVAARAHSVPDCVLENLDKLTVFHTTRDDVANPGQKQEIYFIPCSYLTPDRELNRNAVVEVVLTRTGFCIHRFINNLDQKTPAKREYLSFKDSPLHQDYLKIASSLGLSVPISTRNLPRDESWEDDNYFYARTDYDMILRFPKKRS